MFEEKLIKEVAKHECLWDKGSASYRIRTVKEKAWTDISRKVGESETTCKKRWKSLRDRFVSLYNRRFYEPSGSSETNKKYWVHYDLLLFLKDQVENRKNCSTIESSDHDGGFSTNDYSSDENPLDVKHDISSLLETPIEDTINDSVDEFTAKIPKKNKKIVKESDWTKENLDFPLETAIKVTNVKSYTQDPRSYIQDPRPYTQDPILNVIQEYIDKTEEKYKMSFKHDILNLVYDKFMEYQNK